MILKLFYDDKQIMWNRSSTKYLHIMSIHEFSRPIISKHTFKNKTMISTRNIITQLV